MDTDQAIAALRDDPQATLELGCRIVATAGDDERRHAEVAFELARNSDRTAVWRAADAYAQVADGRAARWMAEGAASLSDPDGIVVDRLTLPIMIQEYDADRWIAHHQDWRIAVHCDDPARALLALHAARARLPFVADDGSTVSDPTQVTGPPGPWYTPNSVFVEPDVPLIWLDCKSGVFPLMARTVLEIVIEELRGIGITRAELSTPKDQ
ncbi:hypothetical protein KGQ19_32075 [Catenulispora sp. NL8]|uniref:Uncharacterized protein n=1 Tax=Catenulispora pinistramenti TaxID=2705254 RepID=A0ABS5KZL5_9ACTN|nr:hypothetical protein [Catenulispora pinistramenti]MBS2551516.1 hypothetical protein [Catenulispora pinistramenti]